MVPLGADVCEKNARNGIDQKVAIFRAFARRVCVHARTEICREMIDDDR